MNTNCKICGIPTDNNGTNLCDRCWELNNRIKTNPILALKILSGILAGNEKQTEKFGKKIIKLLSLKIKKNGRVDTDGGDKTPLGLGRTIIRLLEEVEENNDGNN